MYEELVKKLRYCGKAVSCLHCPYWAGCGGSKEDLMQAADAIEELRKAVLRLEDESGLYDELPTFYIYPTKWIPVTEQLPEAERKSYWICTDTGYQCECRWTNNQFGIGESDEWGWSIADVPQYHKVTAWMFLPEPYKPLKEG